MEQINEEEMYIYGVDFPRHPTPPNTHMFEEFLVSSPLKPHQDGSPAYMNPNDLTVRPQTSIPLNGFHQAHEHLKVAGSPPASASSSSGDSADSPGYDSRKTSMASAVSSRMRAPNHWSSGIQGMKMPTDDGYSHDTDMSGLSADHDMERSNQQMSAAFDFDTAGSTPSAFPSIPAAGPRTMFSGAAAFQKHHVQSKTGAPVQFFFGGSRETSPMNAMLPAQSNTWPKHGSSSGLEETFNGMAMNGGDSPGHTTFPTNLQMHSNAFSLDGSSAGTPSSFAKESSSPPSTAPSIEGSSVLTIYPTSLKSRVETQIPIRMTLNPLPQGVTRLKLPTHTVSKPKFLAKPPAERSPDMLELYTSLVCSSAMQDPKRLERAFARARGDDSSQFSRPSPTPSNSSQSSKDDEDKPLNGGEVRICSGCIQRERKRASRKKQKKPDEEQLFQRDEEKRVVVFNTNEIKDWLDPSKEAQKGSTGSQFDSPDTFPPGTMQVELPMRIACYCRHHNEKLGFQVIFTIKDHNDKVVAQSITNTIMITDDHKTHNPPLTSGPSTLPNGQQVQHTGPFQSLGLDAPHAARLFKQSLSTTDLQGLQNNFNPHFPMAGSSNPFAIPTAASLNSSENMTSRNLSRPPSPTAPVPNNKRRKQSTSKVPSMLAMTRLDTSSLGSGTQSMTNSATSTTFPQGAFSGSSDRGFAMPGSRPGHFGASPPTPSNDHGYIAPVNRSFSMENLANQGMMSAPSSRQQSRSGSPTVLDKGHSNATANSQMFATQGRRPVPLIHKLVPAEGSVLGGTEVTLLGNGFYQGLEIMFGDTEATTTTFWGEKCLNCITPPAIQTGTVSVTFKHEHPQYAQVAAQSQSRQSIFTYVDDREVELYRLALKTLGRRMQNPTDDPYSAAQQLLHGVSPAMWNMQNNLGSSGGQQRQASSVMAAFGDAMEVETTMLSFLNYLDNRGSSGSVSLNLQRPTGHTLLHLACSLGMVRFVAGLLARGANPDVLDCNGNTPMHLAAMFGHSQVVHRLRLAGGDHKIRSIRNFIPADLATSLLAHQAAVLPNRHYRSRSAGSSPMRLHSRNNSGSSLRSFWESSSLYAHSDDYEDSDDDDFSDGSSDLSIATPARATGRRSSGHEDLQTAASFYALSRQGTAQAMQSQPQIVQSAQDQQQPLVSPAAYMLAWRDQLATQIQQYQQSVNWTLPNLSALPSLPAMPDFNQDHPMVRKVSSLFPQRTESRPATASAASTGREGWWGSLTGSNPSSPPAYDDLFPNHDSPEDYELKKSSAITAAGEAAFDRHYESLDSRVVGSASHKQKSADNTKSQPVRHREVKQLKSDRKLFFIWVSTVIVD